MYVAYNSILVLRQAQISEFTTKLHERLWQKKTSNFNNWIDYALQPLSYSHDIRMVVNFNQEIKKLFCRKLINKFVPAGIKTVDFPGNKNELKNYQSLRSHYIPLDKRI